MSGGVNNNGSIEESSDESFMVSGCGIDANCGNGNSAGFERDYDGGRGECCGSGDKGCLGRGSGEGLLIDFGGSFFDCNSKAIFKG